MPWKPSHPSYNTENSWTCLTQNNGTFSASCGSVTQNLSHTFKNPNCPVTFFLVQNSSKSNIFDKMNIWQSKHCIFKHAFYLVWRYGSASSRSSRIWLLARHHKAVTLGKLFTPTCQWYNLVLVVMPKSVIFRWHRRMRKMHELIAANLNFSS